MGWYTGVFFAVVAAFFAFIMWAVERHRRRVADRVRELSARGPLLPAQFAADAGIAPEVVQRVRQVVARVTEQALLPEQVDVDPTRLRPEDCLGGKLGYDDLDSLAFCELLMELENEFGVRLRCSDFREGTVGEVARLVAARLGSGGGHS